MTRHRHVTRDRVMEFAFESRLGKNERSTWTFRNSDIAFAFARLINVATHVSRANGNEAVGDENRR